MTETVDKIGRAPSESLGQEKRSLGNTVDLVAQDRAACPAIAGSSGFCGGEYSMVEGTNSYRDAT